MRVATRRVVCGAVLGAAMLGAGAAFAEPPSAKAVMKKVIANLKYADLKSNCRLTLVSPNGETRIRLTAGASKLKANGEDMMQLVRFLEPAEVRRTGLLVIQNAGAEDAVWLYLPALKKNRRIASSQKSTSFMGTEFTYSDLSVPQLEDYHYRFLPQAAAGQHYVVELTPANDTVRNETGYSRSVAWIRKDNFMQAKMEVYDLAGQKLKTIRSSQFQEVDRRSRKWMAMRVEVVNHQTGKKTLAEFSEAQANTGLPDAMFTLGYLERE